MCLGLTVRSDHQISVIQIHHYCVVIFCVAGTVFETFGAAIAEVYIVGREFISWQSVEVETLVILFHHGIV